jgi:hypothetical protein
MLILKHALAAYSRIRRIRPTPLAPSPAFQHAQAGRRGPGGVLLQVAPIADGLSLLTAVVIPETAKGRFGKAVVLRGVVIL